jgi:antitoxin (DNA-binding transcriptional repressor) of toxin-antitoxin stability system
VPGVVLPPIEQHPSPNQSGRRGVVPYLIVVHRPVGSYAGALRTLTEKGSNVSAHILTDSNRVAAQLVPWHRKAWACASFNAASYNVEIDDDAWNGKDPAALATAARIVAFLCVRTGIPAAWQRQPLHGPGIVRHRDLGRAGGGHSDPTSDLVLWRSFVAACSAEVRRGGFRPVWGVGELQRIDV